MAPTPTPNSCIMYLVRHGATDNNLADPPLLQGRRIDLELSAAGRRQAEQTAQLLSKVPLARVYSSPLFRATETAEAIARHHGLSVQVVDSLTEVDVGQWEGRSWQEISQTDPEAYRRFMDNPATQGYVDGENMTQVLERVQPAIARVLRDNLGHRVAVVAHNVVNRVLLSHVIGLPLQQARSVNQDNCGVTVVRYQDGRMKLLTLNTNFHLDE